jgi:excisionase family DNA binding protein
MEPKKPITATQAGERAACSPKHLQNQIRAGLLRAYKIGKQYRIDPDDLEAWIAAQSVTPSVDHVGLALAELETRTKQRSGAAQ